MHLGLARQYPGRYRERKAESACVRKREPDAVTSNDGVGLDCPGRHRGLCRRRQCNDGTHGFCIGHGFGTNQPDGAPANNYHFAYRWACLMVM